MDSKSAAPSHRSLTIPGYQLLELIGEGGMGEVYRALQVSTARTVAIKVLKPWPDHGGLEATRRLFRESQLMSSLTHPHVVAIYECGQIEGRAFLVMEYVAGPTLRSLMPRESAYSIPLAAELLDTVARALSYIHSRGILHLDLKPENVLCGNRAGLKITDFGLALPQVDAWTLSELGLAQGTIDYCSPEQRYGLPIDERSDLFALATLAYELLTGRLPGRVYLPASRRNPRLSTAVDAVLRRGLARDPDARYPTVEDFRRDLIPALRGARPRPAETFLLLLVGLLFCPFALERQHSSWTQKRAAGYRVCTACKGFSRG